MEICTGPGMGEANGSAERRTLLGTLGWERPGWLADYYPADLPEDWRLAYYANDCGILMLAPADWTGAAAARLAAALAEAPMHLRVFAMAPPGTRAEDCARLAAAAAGRATLLVERPLDQAGGLPQWCARGTDLWADGASDRTLARWWLGAFDLREMRVRVAALDGPGAMLVLDGPGASPARIGELRTLCELLGKA